MCFEEFRIPFFADKIVRIKIIGEDFAAFFFLVKLYNRVFQQAETLIESRSQPSVLHLDHKLLHSSEEEGSLTFSSEYEKSTHN